MIRQSRGSHPPEKTMKNDHLSKSKREWEFLQTPQQPTQQMSNNDS